MYSNNQSFFKYLCHLSKRAQAFFNCSVKLAMRNLKLLQVKIYLTLWMIPFGALYKSGLILHGIKKASIPLNQMRHVEKPIFFCIEYNFTS